MAGIELKLYGSDAMDRVQRFLALAALIAGGPSALACSWDPPTLEQAYTRAATVVHVKVIAQSGSDPFFATIEVLKVYKGEMQGHSVRTTNSAACGMDAFVVGKEYVFFIRQKADTPFISLPDKPKGTTEQILAALAMRKPLAPSSK